MKKRAFLICSVRKRRKSLLRRFLEFVGLFVNWEQREQAAVRDYVNKLETDGYEVHWPLRDTDQNDPVGLRICLDNLRAIAYICSEDTKTAAREKCDARNEVHIWWNPDSEGSRFDFGMAFAIFFLLNRIERIVLANREAVRKLVEEENKRGIGKSFNKVLLELGKWR